MLVTSGPSAKTVTNISKFSRTHFVSNIRHQQEIFLEIGWSQLNVDEFPEAGICLMAKLDSRLIFVIC